MQARKTRVSVILAAVSALTGMQASITRAATKTFTGGSGGTSADLASTSNWSTGSLPTTSDEALFTTATGNGTVLSISPTGNPTWGDLVWNNNVSNTIGNPQTSTTTRLLTLSGAAGFAAAIAAGGATGDLIVMGTNAVDNTLTIGPNTSGGVGTGVIQLVLGASGNFDVVNSGATLVLTGGSITGAFDLAKTGAGKLVFSGDLSNSFGGAGHLFDIKSGSVELNKSSVSNGVAISALLVNVGDGDTGNGTVSVKYTGTSNNQITNKAVVTIKSDGTIDMNGATDVIGGLSGVGTVTNSNTVTASTLTIGGATTDTISSEFTGRLTGKLNLVVQGQGTFTLSTGALANDYTGTTSINGGDTLLGGSLKLAGGSAIPDTSSVIFGGTKSGIVLDLNSTTETVGSLAGGGINVPTISLGSGELITGGDGTSTTFTGAIAGANGKLTKIGNGTQTLAGATANTYTGLTSVSAGKLTLSKSASVNAVGADVVVSNGATLNIAATEQIADSALLTLQGGATLDFTAISKIETVGLSMTDATINNTGTNGTFILTDTYSFAGNNTINVKLQLTTAAGGDKLRTFNIAGSDALTLTGSVVQVTSIASIDKTGTGKLVLTGNGVGSGNNFTGAFNLKDGTVEAAKNQANTNAISSTVVNIGDGAGLANSAVLKLTGASSDQIANTAVVRIKSDGQLILNGKAENIGELLEMRGGTIDGGLLALTAVPTADMVFTGNNLIQAELALGNGTSRTFDVQGSTDALEISGPVSQTAASSTGFTKKGAGTMTLSGSGPSALTVSGGSLLTGGVTVTGGVLQVASTGVINNVSGVNINGGEFRYNSSTTLSTTITTTSGTISGTGKIGTAVATGSAGIISPGDGVGSQEYTAGLDYSAGGTYLWQLGALSTNPGSGDQVLVSGGNLVLGGPSALSVSFVGVDNPDNDNSGFWNSDHTWKVIDFSGAGTSTGDFASVLNGSYTAGTFDTVLGTGGDAGDVFVTFTATGVPEPGSMAFLAIGGLALLRRRRSKSQANILRI